MPRTLNEGLAAAPTFTPHRANVTAADAAPTGGGTPVPPKSAGLDSKGYATVDVELYFTGTIASCVVDVYFWSDGAGMFLPQDPAVTFTGTAARTFRFTSDGRRFWIRVTTLTGTNPAVFIDVAGARGPEEFT